MIRHLFYVCIHSELQSELNIYKQDFDALSRHCPVAMLHLSCSLQKWRITSQFEKNFLPISRSNAFSLGASLVVSYLFAVLSMRPIQIKLAVVSQSVVLFVVNLPSCFLIVR